MERNDIKKIILSEAQQEDNLGIAAYLLENGHMVTLISNESQKMNDFVDGLAPHHKDRCFIKCFEDDTEESTAEGIESILDKMNGLDIFINGLPGANENSLLQSSPDSFGRAIASDFDQLFLLNREIVRYMVRQKAGNIIFLMIDDILHFAGYPASPVNNHGRLSLMKSMAKELLPFRIKVNALTFGIYDPGFNPAEKRAMQKKLEFCALKPPIPKWEDLMPALDALIYPSFKYMTGQNFSASIGSSNT